MKIVVYIDAANIVLSARNLGFDIDIVRLARYIQDTFRPAHIIFFTGKISSLANEYAALCVRGVEVVFKEVYKEGTTVKANCDVDIAHRLTLDVQTEVTDSIILLSGDGDFVPVLDFARAKGAEVRVIAFDTMSCSRMIKRRMFTRVSFLVEAVARLAKESAGEMPTHENTPTTT
jgi:uncharacterized LabA/DUF88 family protein